MKLPFDLAIVFKKIEAAIASYPKAAMFEMYARGYDSVFEQLISCIISIRTLDEITIPVSEHLFAVARTPKEFLKLSPERIRKLIHGCTFAEQKSYTISGIAKVVMNDYQGSLPADFEHLTALKGVGPKCANLVLGVASGKAAISVDVHVHRVMNRLGYIQTKDPVQTMVALEQKIPHKKWTDVNRLLMPFGKHICTGKLPYCSICPVLDYCLQVGVTGHR